MRWHIAEIREVAKSELVKSLLANPNSSNSSLLNGQTRQMDELIESQLVEWTKSSNTLTRNQPLKHVSPFQTRSEHAPQG